MRREKFLSVRWDKKNEMRKTRTKKARPRFNARRNVARKRCKRKTQTRIRLENFARIREKKIYGTGTNYTLTRTIARNHR